MCLQVHQLYETIQRWSPVASTLPELVQRLVTIKQLHEQGGRPAVRGAQKNWKVVTSVPFPFVSDANLPHTFLPLS